MATLKACQKLPQAEREVWECGLVKLANWMQEGKREPIRPTMALWFDLQNGLIVGHELAKETPQPETFLKQCLQTMTAPQMGSPRRPTHLCLKDAALAEYVRAPLAGLGITVEVIDRFIAIDKVVEMLTRTMQTVEGEESKPFPALITVPGVTHEYAEHFYHVAAEFYRHAPWKTISDQTEIMLECPHFFRNPLFFIVMGNGGMEFGLSLFITREEINMLAEFGVPDGETVPPVRTASVLFSEQFYLAFEDLDAIEQNRWEIAAPQAYPHVFKISPKRTPPLRAPSFPLVQAFEAAMLVLPKFISKHEAKIKSEKPCSGLLHAKTFQGSWPLQLRIE